MFVDSDHGAREHPSQMGAAERVLYVPLARDFKSEMIPRGSRAPTRGGCGRAFF